MTSQATQIPPGVTGWVVNIPMPLWVYNDNAGKLLGQPVGWLTTNNLPTTTPGKIRRGKATAKWRAAAAKAYEQHLVPRNLGRIYLTLSFALARKDRIKDSPNLEMTAKPIVDALQPPSTGVTLKALRRGGPKVRVEYPIPGWGVVPNDSDDWVTRGMQQPWLPRVANEIGGLVVVNIIPNISPLR